MNFIGVLLALIGGLGALAGLVSIIIPLRFMGITSRFTAILVLVAGSVLATMGTNLSPDLKAAQAKAERERATAARSVASKPAFTSSGGCKTDANGNMSCSHSANANLFGSSSSATSSMKCGTNPVTLAYECKSEMSSN